MLGRHISAALQVAGAHVVSVSKTGRNTTPCWDLAEWLSLDALDALFGNVQAVVHSGAVIDSVISGRENHMFDVNVRSCCNLAEWSVSRSIPLIFISSASVYADPESGSLSEDAPIAANHIGNFYGMTKLMAENILECYRPSGLKLAVLRPSSLYGFGGPTNKVIYKFLNLAANGKVINLTPPADDSVDFLHAADLSRAVVDVLESACWEVLNIASGRPVSIRELALACVEVSGRGSVRMEDVDLCGRPPAHRFLLDTTVARDRLGWVSTIGIEQGLKMVRDGKLVAGRSSLSK
jgi:UDP-glucose 4-epimerase